MEENYYLAKWLNNEITEEELKKYISEDELRAYKKIIAATNTIETPHFNSEESLAKIKQLRKNTKVKKLSFVNYFYKVAAVFTVLVASYYFISNKTTNYTTNLAEKTTLELPDNSKVDLNADSHISYKKKSWKTTRDLNLKGEAFFSVQKGSKFTVNTNLGSVSVLGTKFNVVVRDSYFEVNCYEGLVSVTYHKQTIKIPAGSGFKLLSNNELFTKNIPGTEPSWLQNSSSFTSMPYNYVVNELERQYNISIEYDSSFANNLFTGNFTHTNLDNALKAISIPLNLKYTKISDKKVSLH